MENDLESLRQRAGLGADGAQVAAVAVVAASGGTRPPDIALQVATGTRGRRREFASGRRPSRDVGGPEAPRSGRPPAADVPDPSRGSTTRVEGPRLESTVA